MKVLYEQSDILYVKESPPRLKVLKFLNSKQEFVKTKEITNALKIIRGNLYFHIKGLNKKALVEFQRSTPRSLYVRITEKGKQVVEEIERKEKKGSTPS